MTLGWLTYARGNLPMALQHFGRAVARDPKRYGHVRFTRASAFVNLAQFDSAYGEVATLLEQLRAADEKTLGRMYESKEFLEFAVARLHAQRNRLAPACEALGRSLSENMGFAPAHEALGRFALASRDSATALLEFGAAMEADPSDPPYRLGLAEALIFARRAEEAATLLTELVHREPLWAEPRYHLGVALEATGRTDGAIIAYGDYLKLASRNGARRAASEARLRALGATPPR